MKKQAALAWLGFGLLGIANGQIKVACIGNSITEGYGLADAAKESYPSRLKALLGSGYTVQNDGASGRTMLKSDARNSYWKFGKLGQALALKPDIVAIELGTNDANNFAGQWNSVSAEFKADYLAMIDTLNTLNVKPRIFAVQPLPIRGNNDATLVKANALIKQAGLERGATVVDCYTPFSGQAQLYKDGLHPNAAGADTMAHIIYRAILKTVAIADSRPGSAGNSLFADFAGSGFTRIEDALADGGRYRIQVLDIRGAILFTGMIQSGSPGLAALHARLRAAHGVNRVSLQPLR